MNVMVILWATCSPLLAQNEQDNPEFKAWNGFKAGSTVTLKSETELNGTKSSDEMTTTILEVAEDKVIIEMKGKYIRAGKETDSPARKREIPAKRRVDQLGPNAPRQEPDKTDTKTGEEDLEINGVKIKCKWTEVTMTFNRVDGGKDIQRIKTWKSDQIPGHLVREEAGRTDSGKSVRAVTRFEIK